MEPEHPYFDTIAKDPRYAQEPQGKEFPMYESLKLTIDRTLPYWNSKIVPQIKEGKKILIAAHGNSLRGIVKHLDNISDEDIMLLNLPTGIPFVYELDENMKPIKSMQFLGDEETVKKAIESVANQGKAFVTRHTKLLNHLTCRPTGQSLNIVPGTNLIGGHNLLLLIGIGLMYLPKHGREKSPSGMAEGLKI